MTSTLHALKYVIVALDTTAISRIFIAIFFTSALVFSVLLELQSIAEKRKCNPPELTLGGSVDADAGDLCSLSLALLDSSPRGLHMLAPGWLCVVVTSTCSCVLQTPVAADVLDVATTIYAVICVVLIYVRGRCLPLCPYTRLELDTLPRFTGDISALSQVTRRDPPKCATGPNLT